MKKVSKQRIFSIIQIGQDSDFPSRFFDIALIVMILSNLLIAILETFDRFAPYQGLLNAVELVTVLCFSVEYALRVWTAEFLYPGVSKGKAALRYIFSFPGMVDLVSFLPYYLPIFFPAGVVAFRMFRVIRILRLFRVNAYYDALNVIGDVIKGKRDQLLSSIFIILVLMTASSLCMYSLEHEAQPEVFRNAFSGFWWAVSTLLTVGYGDIYPVTLAGRVFGIVITFLGVGMVAIPTGILSAGFVEQYTRLKTTGSDTAVSEVPFLRLCVGEGHPWQDRRVKELSLPPGLSLAMIQRGEQVLVPGGDTCIRQGDGLILAGEQAESGIALKELKLNRTHPWVGQRVRDLDISRQTLIVTVRRKGKVILPDGNLRLAANDLLLIYSKRRIASAHAIEI